MITLASPAKINLFLRIISRRPNGYHDLASLFQTISLCDTLSFSKTDSDTDVLTCNDPTIPTDSSNLVLMAANVFRRHAGRDRHFGLNIHLEKRIPHQAGLGGGSGNAATTLWALNQLSGSPFNLEQLITFAGEIGSDVAFFLSHGTAYCTGRGELIKPVPALKPTTLWIIKPIEGVSTPEVYRRLNVASLINRDPDDALKRFLNGQPVYFNDLEKPAFEVLPKLLEVKKKLIDHGFSTVLLSGSGSSFFCIGNENVVPRSIAGVQSYKVSYLNRSNNEWYIQKG